MKNYLRALTLPLLYITTLFSSHIEKDISSYDFKKIADSPEIYECTHFLSDSECDKIIKKAKPTLTKSTVIDNNSSKGLLDSRRTSLGTFLSTQSEITAVQKIRTQAERITGLPKKNGENLQVLYYSIGAEYQPHFDWFDPDSPGGLIHYNRGGQRVATLLIYLNTPIKGGETIFPKARVSINPTKGKAVLFYNVDLQGRPDLNSLHGGAPVISGEKWIATLWLREHKFQ